MKVRETSLAVHDLAGILDRVNKRSKQGAGYVAAAYDAARDHIGRLPYAAARIRERDLWRLPLVKYPYTIFYRVLPDRDEVQILRVVHSARVKNLRKLPKGE